MRENIWYTVARTSDKECVGRVLFSIGSTELVFDNLIQFGNISISIVRAAVEADTVFSMRIRSHGGFYYVDIRSSKEYASDPVFSVDQILNTLVALPFAQAGSGKQECIVSTDAYAPAPDGRTYVTLDTVQAITALKYFENGLAIGTMDRYWPLLFGEDGIYLGDKRVLVTTDIAGFVNGGSYNSTTKYIELKHDNTTVASIDARAFIKDGMVDSVVVDNGYLVITFNTDSGKEPISISLGDVFDPANYYTKTDINTLLGNYVTLNTNQEITGEKYFSNALAIPLSAPSSPTAGRSYLYSGSGSYAEEPSGGGGGNVYPLTITKNGSAWLYYAPDEDAVSVNLSVPTKVSDLANDTGFITSSALSGYATESWVLNKGYITSSALADYVTLATDQHNITGSKSFTNRVNLAYAYITGYLSIPTAAPSVPLSGYTYLWSDTNGNYSELPSGGGAANVYDLTIRRGSVSVGPYNLGEQAADIDLASLFSGYATQSWVNTQIGNIDFTPYALKTQIPTKVSDLENDTGFITSSALSGYVNTIEQGDGNYVTGISKDGKKLVISRSTLPTKLSDFTDDVVSGNYLPIHGTADKALRLSGDAAHTAWGQTFWQNGVPKSISGSLTSVTNITGSGLITMPKGKFSSSLIIPHVAPSGTLESGEAYLYAGTGEYAEEPSGGGVADIYDLTIRKNGSLIGTYNLGEQAANVNIPIGWADLTEDASHKFVSQSEKDTWSAKQNAISDLTTIRGNANKGATAYSWGDHSLAGYATPSDISTAISALGLGTASKRNVTDNVSQNNNNLPTSGAVYSAIAAAVTSALHYRGMSSTQLTDGGTEVAVIGGTSLVAQSGDVVIYGGFEFLWEEGHWNKLGDDSSYALKTVSISAGTGLTGGGDLTAARTISLSQSTINSLALADSALQSSDMKALTLKVGSITVASNYNALTARTYTITKANITDTIGNTTYAPYHADGYLPLSAGSTKPLTGDLYFDSNSANKHIYFKYANNGLGSALRMSRGGSLILGENQRTNGNSTSIYGSDLFVHFGTDAAPYTVVFSGGIVRPFNSTVSLGSSTSRWDEVYASKVYSDVVKVSDILAIPTSAPSSTASGEVYLWASSLGEYAETPSGGGTATIYDLTIRKNGTSLGTINLGEQAGNINIPVGWSDLTPDASHRFLTDSLISTWNAKQDAISDLATIRSNASHGNTAYDWGNHADAGYLTSFTETDPTVPGWAKASTKPTYTLDEVTDGSTRKLANYLPLTGGTISGTLEIVDSSDSKIILKSGDADNYNLIKFVANDDSVQGYLGTRGTTVLKWNNYVIYHTNNLSLSTLGGVPTTRKVNNKALSADITLSLDDVADGSTRKLSNYLPLTGGTLTGGLTLSNVDQTFDVSAATRSIYYKASDAVSYRGVIFGTNGDLTIGYDGPSHSKSLYLDGFNEYLRFGSTKQYSVKLNSTGTVELSGISAVLPVTANEVNLGSSAKAFNNIYGKLDLSYVQSASDLKAIEALTGTGLAKRTADNTWELTDTADKAEELVTSTEEDAMFTYRQVPSEAVGDVCKTTAVKGKSAVWNQRVQNGDFAGNINGWGAYNSSYARVSYGSGSIITTILQSGYGYSRGIYTQIGGTVVAGNTYYVAYTVKSSVASSYGVEFRSSNIKNVAVEANKWTRVAGIIKAAPTDTLRRLILKPQTTLNVNDTFEIKDVILSDLTQMFGSGNEPATVEEFEALYPLPYYDYNAGELVNNAASGVEMVGFNQWDEEWEVGYINPTNGIEVQQNNRIRFKNFMPVIGGATYYVYNKKGVQFWKVFYDADKNFLTYNQPYVNRKFTVPDNAAYMRCGFETDQGTTYDHDICINISDPSRNGEYQPYKTSTLPTPITELTSGGVQIFPDGMKSAGTAYDEWSGTTAVKRIGVVDLGTLTWIADSIPNTFYTTDVRDYAYGPSSADATPFVCAKYSDGHGANNSTATGMPDKSIRFYNRVPTITARFIWVCDSAYSNAATFKAAMSGVLLYYELATPVTYTTDQPLPGTLAEFENGGTMRRLPVDTTSEVIAPMICDFQYGANMSDVAKAYLPLSGGTVTGTLEAAGELIIPDSAPRNPDSTKVYLYCDTTGNYYQS